MSDLSTFIEGMPKAELHVHLEGTLEPELKFELAARNGLDLPYGSADEMRAAYRFDDLPSFLAVYYEGMSVLLAEQDFYDLATAYFRRPAPRTSSTPRSSSIRRRTPRVGFPSEQVVEGLHRAQQDAETSLGLRSQLIMCFLRDMSADPRWTRSSSRFARARSEGYRLTMLRRRSSTSGNASTRSEWRESTTASTRSRTKP